MELLSHGISLLFSGKLEHQQRQGGSSAVGCALKELRVSLLNSMWEHLFCAMGPHEGSEAAQRQRDEVCSQPPQCLPCRVSRLPPSLGTAGSGTRSRLLAELALLGSSCPGFQPRAAASFSDTETHQHTNLFRRWDSDDTFTTRLIQSTSKWLPRGEVRLCLLAASPQPSLQHQPAATAATLLLKEGIRTAESFSPPLILIWISSLSLVAPLLYERWRQHNRTGEFPGLG